ncbi:short-chain dehydrogenase/reductase, partial [Bacillus sp. Nf3]
RSARQDKSGQQLGDPVKAAQAMLQIIDSDAPPSHLLLGSDALQLVRAKLASMAGNIDAWEPLSRSTDSTP